VFYVLLHNLVKLRLLRYVVTIGSHFSCTSCAVPDERAFRSFIYLSQIVQTLCITAETEHYRRGRDTTAYTMGALYWSPARAPLKRCCYLC